MNGTLENRKSESVPNVNQLGGMSKEVLKKLRYKLWSINQRCKNPNSQKFKYYGGKGIKNEMTIEDLIFLWDRDCGERLKTPSIHRINTAGNYCLANCRFLENSFNAGLGARHKDPQKLFVDLSDLDSNVKRKIYSLSDLKETPIKHLITEILNDFFNKKKFLKDFSGR